MPIIKRLIACFGSIQLVTVLSVLSYREKQQQELNLNYENYLVITPLFAPQGQDEEFAAFIEKMARSIYSWEKIVYIPLNQKNTLAKDFKRSGLAKISKTIHQLLAVNDVNEIYLAHEYEFLDQLLLNTYTNAEKICYGNGIGIYTARSAFPQASSLKDFSSYWNHVYTLFKARVKQLLPQQRSLHKQEFDIGYFSLPSAFSQAPLISSVILDRTVYLETFQKLTKKIQHLINYSYISELHDRIKSNQTSILLTSNFSEASGRMSLENEIAAYVKFLDSQEISKNSILLIKPHPRDSKEKIIKLKSALSSFYTDIVLLTEDFLFYLPFELFFIMVFLNPELPKLPNPRIFTFSSACLTLELILSIQCVVGFGTNIVEEFFYPDHVVSRIQHEADLQLTIGQIRKLNSVLV